METLRLETKRKDAYSKSITVNEFENNEVFTIQENSNDLIKKVEVDVSNIDNKTYLKINNVTLFGIELKVFIDFMNRNLKTLVVLFMMSISTIGFSQRNSSVGWLFVNENTIALDKQAHGAGGLYLGTLSYFIGYEFSGNNRKRGILYGLLIPTLAGFAKELHDQGKAGNRFDWADLAYTIGGGIVATFAFDFLNGKNLKKRKILKD